MKILFAVISYAGDAINGSHQAIRDTWGKDVMAAGADLAFFIGKRQTGWEPKSKDEILTNAEALLTQDDHDYFQYLIKEMLRWSIRQGYDFTFLCCNDTFIIPEKLMASGFEKFDYSGFFVPRDIPLGTKTTEDVYGHKLYLWADAGAGWFLSKKAAKIVVDSKCDQWGGDIWIGQTLGPLIATGEILASNLKGFWNEISWHYRWVTGQGYNPRTGWMKEMYQKHGGK